MSGFINGAKVTPKPIEEWAESDRERDEYLYPEMGKEYTIKLVQESNFIKGKVAFYFEEITGGPLFTWPYEQDSFTLINTNE